jgi:hypothetical protein
VGLIFLVGCLGVFGTQVRISRFLPQPDSTSYQIGASRMINEPSKPLANYQIQTSVEDYGDQLYEGSNLYKAGVAHFRATPVSTLTLALPLSISLRAPPQKSA